MAVPANIELLAAEVRTAIHGIEVREALASSMEQTSDIADWARSVAQNLIDGQYEEALLATEIESKLNQLEIDYAPTLNSIESEVTNARGTFDDLAAKLLDTATQLSENAPVLAQTLSKEKIDIGIGFGQSNLWGAANNTLGDPPFKTPNVTVWDGIQEIPLTNYTPTQNDGTSTGGMFVSFANEYARKTGRKAIIANCAKRSQSIADLSKGAPNTNYSGMVQWVNGIKNHIIASGKTVGKVFILWCQGERDSADSTPTSQYKLALETLWTDIKIDTGADLFSVFTVGYYNDDRKMYAWAIQSVQRKFAKENTDVIVAFDDIESLNAHGMKVDGVHLNQIGYNYMGEQGAKSIVPSLFTDNSYQQDELISRQGLINLDGSQEWKKYGGWLTKSNNFVPTTLSSRAISNIISTTIETDHIAITLADKIDYILDATATILAVDGSSTTTHKLEEGGASIRPIFDRRVYNTVDSEGRTVVKLFFIADLNVRAKLVEQTIDTLQQGASLVNNLSATFGVGTTTITHPATRMLSRAGVRNGGAPYCIDCTSASTYTTITCWDLTGNLANKEVVVDIKDVIIDPTTLSDNCEIMFSVIGANKSDS